MNPLEDICGTEEEGILINELLNCVTDVSPGPATNDVVTPPPGVPRVTRLVEDGDELEWRQVLSQVVLMQFGDSDASTLDVYRQNVSDSSPHVEVATTGLCNAIAAGDGNSPVCADVCPCKANRKKHIKTTPMSPKLLSF